MASVTAPINCPSYLQAVITTCSCRSELHHHPLSAFFNLVHILENSPFIKLFSIMLFEWAISFMLAPQMIRGISLRSRKRFKPQVDSGEYYEEGKEWVFIVGWVMLKWWQYWCHLGKEEKHSSLLILSLINLWPFCRSFSRLIFLSTCACLQKLKEEYRS